MIKEENTATEYVLTFQTKELFLQRFKLLPVDEEKPVTSMSEVEGHKINDSEDKITKVIEWCDKRLADKYTNTAEEFRILREIKTFLQSL